MDIFLCLLFLILVLVGLVLAARDWRTWRHGFSLLTTLAFLLLVPVGLWDIYSVVGRTPVDERLVYQALILGFCFFVYFRQHLGLTGAE
jgi:hypothetical protein